MLKIEEGTKKSLFTLLAIIIFGIFLSLSYWMFQSEFTGILTDVLEGVKSGSLEKIGAAFDSDKTLGPYGDPTILPTPASDFEFDPITGTLIRYTGTAQRIVVPFEIDGVTVENIGSGFSEKSNHVFNDIILPNTIKRIEGSAFIRSNLIYVNLPDSVEFIGTASFGYNEYIQSFTVGDNLKTIADYAFVNAKIKDIKLPNVTFTIGNGSFQSTTISKIDLGGATSLGNLVFNMSEIGSINFPKNKFTIGTNGFQNSKILSDINLGGLTALGNNAFQGSEIQSIVFPKTALTIGTYTFFNAKLKDLNLGGVTSIGDNAFQGSVINSIIFPKNNFTIGSRSFYEVKNLQAINLSEVTSIGSYAFQNTTSLKTATVGNGISHISEGLFLGSSVESVTFESGGPEKTFARAIFTNATKLTKLDLPQNSKSFGGKGILVNSGLKEFTYPGYMKEINDSNATNMGGANIEVLSFEEGITKITETFSELNGKLTKVNFPDSLITLGNNTFAGGSVTVVNFGLNLESIGDYTFVNNNLTEVNFNNNLKNIGNDAFLGNDLTTLVLPNSVTKIGVASFNNNKLTSIKLSTSMSEIPESAFANNQLTSITIPNHITKIGDGAFYGNLIKHVVIPDSVTSLGKGAFTSDSLQTVELPHSYIGKDLTGLFPENVEITYR